MLNVAAAVLLLMGVPWERAAVPGMVQLALHYPGHVLQDRRDELKGGMRLKLQGVRPRPKLEPRSRVKPAASQLPRRQPALSIPPTMRRSGRLPRPVQSRALAACRARYRSFDEASGTYRTFAGVERRCPFLP